jgi:hypothetical protein
LTIEKSITKSDTTVDEDDISSIIEEMKVKLDKINEREKENILEKKELSRSKKEIVLEGATKIMEIKLSRGESIDTVSTDLTKELKGRVSETYVRRLLDKKLKQKIQSDNASKQKKSKDRVYDDNKSSDTSVAKLDGGGGGIEIINRQRADVASADVDDMISITEIDPNENNKKKSLGANDISVIDIDAITQINENNSVSESKGEQQVTDSVLGTSKIACLECPIKGKEILDLEQENFQLKEVIQKSGLFKTAMELKSDSIVSCPEPVIPIEYSMKRSTMQKNLMGLTSPSTSIEDEEIWLNIRYEWKTKIVMSFGFGRLDQLQNNANQEDSKVK